MRQRKTIFIIGSLLLLLSLGLVAFMRYESASDLLTAALTNMEAIDSGHAVITAAVDLPDQNGSATIEVWAQKDAGSGLPAFRIEVLDAQLPADMGGEHDPVGMIAVSDGSQLWLYEPSTNTVYVGTAAELAAAAAEQMNGHALDKDAMPAFDPEAMPENAAEAVALLLEYVTADRVSTDDLADGRAYQIRLVPIPEQMPDEVRAVGGLINVWVDTELRLPVAAEYTGGALGTARISASDLQVNIDIDPATFTFSPPRGATIVNIVDLIPEADELTAEEQANLRQPAALPAGARLLETVQMAGVTVQQYNLVDGAFTIAQGAPNARFAPDDADSTVITVRGVDGTVFADAEGGRVLLTWIEGDTQFWIGGDLTVDEAVSLAESLE